MDKLRKGYGRGTEESLYTVLKVCGAKQKCFEFSIPHPRTCLIESLGCFDRVIRFFAKLLDMRIYMFGVTKTHKLNKVE